MFIELRVFRVFFIFLVSLILFACGGGENSPTDEQSSNANLNMLTSSIGSLAPGFDPGTLNYTINVVNSDSSVTLSATTEESGASLNINSNTETSGVPTAPINLNVGANPIEVVVTATDGTTKTYTVTVIRAGLTGSSVNLSDLQVSYGALNPVFFSGQLSYSLDAPFLISSIMITPTAEDGNAVITIDNSAVASGQASAAFALAEGNGNNFSIKVTAANGLSSQTYMLNINRETASNFAEQAYIKSSTERTEDFGGSNQSENNGFRGIAIDGDTLVVSTPLDTYPDVVTVLGGVHIFVRDNGVWNLQQRISSTETSDAYGTAIALSGDTLAVGAAQDNSFSGAVYIYTRSSSTWTEQQVLREQTPTVSHRFGQAIALEGDTLAVGIPLHEFEGAVNIFTRAGSTWTEQAQLKPLNINNFDSFGAKVELFGDTLAVSAWGEVSDSTGVNTIDNNGTGNKGAVYVFTGSGDTWTQQAYIKNDATLNITGGNFSSRIALYKDTLAIGFISTGTVYIYTRDGAGNWSRQDSVISTVLMTSNVFGNSIALYRDTLVVGADDEDSDATGINGNQSSNASPSSGAVFIFARDGENWNEQAYIKAENAQTGDRFGSSVAISADTLVVTAADEENSARGINPNTDDNTEIGLGSGAVYVYR